MAPSRAQSLDALAPWEERLASSLPDIDGPVVVACSGGTDSLALLALVVAAGLDAVAVHVDHGLRDGSAAEGEHVVAMATAIGASARTVKIDVSSGPGLEARARAARYAVLEAERAAVGANWILVAHTADDQAETVLLNLLRGAATTGLSGMPERRGSVARPLLGLRRADTESICVLAGLSPLADPMNRDHSFRRVWVRERVLPLLEEGTGRDVRALLARQARVLREESDFLDELAMEVLAEAGDPPLARVLATAPTVLARRAVRGWLGPPPPSLDEVEGVLDVARGHRRAVQLVGGVRVARSRGRLLVSGGLRFRDR